LLRRDGEQLSETLLDTSGNGRADQRDIYLAGRRARLEIDTNGDGRPDVVQHLEGDDIRRQDEDSNYDGVMDRSFEGQTPVSVEGSPEAPRKLPNLECGGFDPFWKSH
jgi:hypothetical protein